MSTFQKLRVVICDISGVDSDRVTPDARFDEDLGLDSLDLVETVMEAEVVFGVEISDEALEKIRTVQQAIDAVDQALSCQGAAA